MHRKSKVLVLDSWAMLAYLGDEPAGEPVEDLIADALECGATLQISVINAGEIWSILAREVSVEDAEQAIADIRSLGILLVEADWVMTRAAARLKATHKMSYADCFAAALASERKAELVTGDPEFRQVEHSVKIRWV